jgi:hypothetical protein
LREQAESLIEKIVVHEDRPEDRTLGFSAGRKIYVVDATAFHVRERKWKQPLDLAKQGRTKTFILWRKDPGLGS